MDKAKNHCDCPQRATCDCPYLKKKPTIAQLTAENERLLRVVEQSTKGMSIDEYGDIWIKTGVGQWMRVGNNDTRPELHAELLKRDDGNG